MVVRNDDWRPTAGLTVSSALWRGSLEVIGRLLPFDVWCIVDLPWQYQDVSTGLVRSS